MQLVDINEPPHVLSSPVLYLNENVTVGSIAYNFSTFDEEGQFVNHTIVRARGLWHVVCSGLLSFA
jgi:hypothetical protein